VIRAASIKVQWGSARSARRATTRLGAWMNCQHRWHASAKKRGRA